MNNSSLLSVKDLCVWYKKGKYVLSDFSLDLGANEVVGLIGLNGAGKTTLIKTLSGLIQTFDLDTVMWNGKSISFRSNYFKQERYTVFAESCSFQYFTFNEYISYVASSYKKELINVSALINGFHFEEFSDVILKELSTGNLKKAFLICAFALRPKLLLLDEPVNGLDFQSTEYLYQLMMDYRKYGTILFSSHILESICLTSDRVLVLEHGKITKSFLGDEIGTDNIREVLTENGNS